MYLPLLGGDWDAVVDRTRTAEGAGFDVLWVGDHLDYPPGTPSLEAWTVLAAVAPMTTATLAIVTAAVSFRPAAVFAKMATTLQHVSGGRFRCVLGAGVDEAEHRTFGVPFGTPRERVDRLADYAAVCQRLWASDDPIEHDGPAALLQGAVNRPGPPSPIELGFGGGGRRIIRLAATVGDELCIGLREDIEEPALRLRDEIAVSGRSPRCSALVPFIHDAHDHWLAGHPRDLNVAPAHIAEQMRRYRAAGVQTLYLVPAGSTAAEVAASRIDEIRRVAADTTA